MASLVCKETKVRVSSVLNRDVKQFGKQFMFDGDDETCWNSDQGSPQWVRLQFPTPVSVSELQIKFQGGFVGSECTLSALHDDSGATNGGAGEEIKLCEFYPEDVNSLQTFSVTQSDPCPASTLKVTFSSSTDFFGRITIYELNIIGNKTE